MRNLIKIILVMGAAYWAFTAWNRPSSDTAYPTMSMPTDLKAGHVMVVAAENCTKAAAQQADAITLSLKAKNIPVQRVHWVQFKPQSREDAQQIQKVMPVQLIVGSALSTKLGRKLLNLRVTPQRVILSVLFRLWLNAYFHRVLRHRNVGQRRPKLDYGARNLQ